jgi:hypothetical protein
MLYGIQRMRQISVNWFVCVKITVFSTPVSAAGLLCQRGVAEERILIVRSAACLGAALHATSDKGRILKHVSCLLDTLKRACV